MSSGKRQSRLNAAALVQRGRRCWLLPATRVSLRQTLFEAHAISALLHLLSQPFCELLTF
jgi:hypothetical protein